MLKLFLYFSLLYLVSFTGYSNNKSSIKKGKTILFIHGMFVIPEYWNNWIQYYQSKGYKCIGPPWPYHNKPVEELKSHSDKNLGRLNLNDIVYYYEKIIDSLGEQPILIGHSMGGLVVQKLLDKKRGSAGVAISSAPP